MVDITYCHFQKENKVFRMQAKAWSILRVRRVLELSSELKAFPNLTSWILLGRLKCFLSSLLNEHVHAQSPDIKMSCVCLQDKTIQMYNVGSKRTYVIARNVPDDKLLQKFLI